MTQAVDFAASRKAAERQGLVGSGDYFKAQEGPNRFRLVSACIPHEGEYKGTKTFKWLCYVIDRSDGQVKPYFMPHSVYKQIEALQTSEDYAFGAVPMPYDVTLNARGAGTKEVDYSLVPARKNTPLTPQEEADLAQKKPLLELQNALRAKTNGGPVEAPKFDPDEIPF